MQATLHYYREYEILYHVQCLGWVRSRIRMPGSGYRCGDLDFSRSSDQIPAAAAAGRVHACGRVVSSLVVGLKSPRGCVAGHDLQQKHHLKDLSGFVVSYPLVIYRK